MTEIQTTAAADEEAFPIKNGASAYAICAFLKEDMNQCGAIRASVGVSKKRLFRKSGATVDLKRFENTQWVVSF